VRSHHRFAALAIPLTLVLAAATACSDGDKSSSDPAPTGSAVTTVSGSVPRLQTSEGLSAVEIAQNIAPSIVRVQTESASIDFLGRVVPSGGVGTGVIINGDGHIVTNNHVITAANSSKVADKITVTLSDQRTAQATVVGRDSATDLAVLKIDEGNLVPASWGDSAHLEVGQDVLAVGFALGLEGAPSLTRGVISAVNRTIQEQPYTIPDAIQTDAGINPGNSGGPLLNANGEVIGINTAIIRGAQNIGFAINVSLARPIIEQLITDGHVERAYMGIGSVDVTPGIASNFGLSVDKGIAVTVVASGSPAADAGLRANDVIVSIGGDDVANNGDLLALLARHSPGDTVDVVLYRDKEKHTIQLTLGSREGD
jgi:S1-C subfamily serine protease